MIIDRMAAELDGFATLPGLGVIRVHGDDAAAFLHGQLTQDVVLMPTGEARLAAYCTAKGRMLASFVVIKRSSVEVLLVCSKDLLAQSSKRLSMFVLRAKARIEDASGQFVLCGLIGPAVAQIAGADGPAWQLVDCGAVKLVHLYPADAVARALWIAPFGAAPPAVPLLPAGLWEHCEVLAGVATLAAVGAELYVPQMLNYESVGGVNFNKGCYPGQEVVARSQFRGTLKRRAFLVSSASAMVAGDALFSAEDPEQPVASVVQTAANPAGGYDALVSGQVSALQLAQLHLGSASGAIALARPAPYPLLDDI